MGEQKACGISSGQLKNALQMKERMDKETIREACICRIGTQAVSVIDEKRKRRRIGFMSFLGRQVRFIGWRIWLMQGIGMILLCGMGNVMFRELLASYIHNIPYFLCFISILVLFSTVPLVYRSFRYAMYETELATRFSAVRLLAARLLAIALGNFVILGVILLLAASQVSIPASQAVLYLLLPYLAASGGFLYLLRRIPAERSQICSVCWGCLLACLFTLLKRFCPFFFRQTFSPGWAVVCLALLFFCIGQFRNLIYDSVYTQMS